MTEFERFVLLLGCKATLILAIVAALYLLVGRRWPQGCTTWLRLGVIALWALPAAVWALPTIGIPVLSAPRLATKFPQVARSETAVWQELSAHRHNRGPSAQSNLTAAVAAEPGRRGWSLVKILGLWLAATYSLVVVVLAIRFVGALLGLNQLRRASLLVRDPAWQSTLAHWSRELQVRRPVELRSSDTVSVPMTFGWRVPVILVPIDCLSACSKTQREAIIIHELTHIARSDFFWQALTQLTALMYWMHPLIWLVRRQDGTLRERICDAFCSQQLSRAAYAQALVRIAGRKILRPAAALGIAMAHPSSLQRRLNDLEARAAARCSIPNRTQRAFLGGTAAFVLGLIVVGTLTPRVSAVGNDDKSPRASAVKASRASFTKPPASPNNSAKKVDVAPVRLPATIEGHVVDQQDKPVANANVTVTIQRFNPYVDPADPAAPKPWTATTDNQGRYTLTTGESTLGPDDEVRIKIQADGFADSSNVDYERQAVKGSLRSQRLHAGRRIRARLVDPDGNPVAEAIVRFQANSEEMTLLWDSGPVPVDKLGAFSVTIPKEGKAAFAIYPRGFAPRIVDVPEDGADLGAIRVEGGTSLTGRVVDKQGHGVAGTVVAIQSVENRILYAYMIVIATAAKTDEQGRFTLPPVRGSYKVRVTSRASDYSRRFVVTGSNPPPILPEKIDFDGIARTQDIEFREAVTVAVRGTIRWSDGTPVPDVEVTAYMMPDDWGSGTDLASTRTDAEGHYVLNLPAPVERACVAVYQAIRAPDGKYRQAKSVGNGADAGKQHRTIKFDLLTDDVEDADWEVSSNE